MVTQALEQRSRIALSRLKALRLARNLLDTTRTPHALQQVCVRVHALLELSGGNKCLVTECESRCVNAYCNAVVLVFAKTQPSGLSACVVKPYANTQ